MFAVSRRRRHHVVDFPVPEQVDWPLAAQAGIARQHEVDAHPWVFDREGIEHLTDAAQQAVLTDLEGRVDIAVANVEPEDMITLALAAEALRRDAEMLGDLPRGERAAFGLQHVALHL